MIGDFTDDEDDEGDEEQSAAEGDPVDELEGTDDG